jgi:predicted O-methyltransferase YrrM
MAAPADILARFFPVPTQTTDEDKTFLLAALGLMRRENATFSYLEIGSYRGGSLTPFLMDPGCDRVVSIDERGKALPDERGKNIDYTGFTQQDMIDGLHAHGIPTDKLTMFDGSIEHYDGAGSAPFDLAFIDGEHTDAACFRDFLWTLPLMRPDSIVMFHDRTFIHNALRLIDIYLRKDGRPYRTIHKADSEMSAIAFGRYRTIDLVGWFGAEEPPDAFHPRAEFDMIRHMLTNRVKVEYTLTVVPPPTNPAA